MSTTTPGPGAAAVRVDSAAAETHVRLLAERQLRRAAAAPRSLGLGEDFQGGHPPEEEGLLRVRAVLSALRKVGAISDLSAHRLLGEFCVALATRGMCTPDALFSDLQPDAGRPTPGSRAGPSAASPAAAVPGGSYRAIPIGAAVPADLHGHPGLLYLQTLVLAPGRAAIMTNFISSWRGAARPPGTGVTARSPTFPPFGDSGLTDDQGQPYRLNFEAGDAGWPESGVLDLSPIPPPGTGWLDMPVGPEEAIRIELAGSTPEPGREEPGTPRAPGELLLEAVAETILGGGPMTAPEATELVRSLAEVADALEAAGTLPWASPMPVRLARLARWRATEVHGHLAGQARDLDLPGPWASVLSRGRRQEGRRGVVPAAAVLPEIDGTRFVLAGLVSWEHHATLPVFVWGWDPRPHTFRVEQPFSWWARDNAGRWHVGRCTPFNSSAGTFSLTFSPPLHPDATSLDIILTGRSSRVTVTVPLTWTGRLARPSDQDMSY